MVSADTARTVVGIIGNIISFFLFISPAPTFVGIWKKGSVEQYSPAPYLATLANCMVWTLFGLPMVHPDSILVSTINGTGTAIEFAYITLFFIHSDKKNRLKVIAVVTLELIFFALLTLLVLTLAHTYSTRSMVVGMVCILFNVMMYASPLTVMKMVITTKSVEYMPFFLSFASFANAVTWTTFALIRFDPFIAAPNGFGALLGLAQLILYATYYKSTKQQIEARKAKEIDFPEVIVAANQPPNKTATAATENGGAYENHET
ncbi:hypothetical protein FNV43_RR09455 [Rhamnella rubrinervis]|uniref:Bidirectional sugar transporter SWEET n=2 Tax=Magnoliopsida TaxID=3398 RepID=A0A8K0HA04_9ROSA|nr:hypothetical protein FNV43_RR09455 [Rhamnella rubrinervis]